MKVTPTRILLAAAALALISAQADAQDRMQGSGIKVTKDRPAVSTTPSSETVTVGGEVVLTTPFDINAYANMSEKNLTALLAAGDSLEMQLTSLAQTKATDARVRDYATMMYNDHTAHLPLVLEIITDEGVGAEPPAIDPEGMRMRQMLTELRNMKAGTSWDAAFVRFQVGHHQNVIDILNKNIKNAHDDDFERLIEKTLVSLAKHRDHGRSIATQLGVTLP